MTHEQIIAIVHVSHRELLLLREKQAKAVAKMADAKAAMDAARHARAFQAPNEDMVALAQAAVDLLKEANLEMEANAREVEAWQTRLESVTQELHKQRLASFLRSFLAQAK